MEKINIEVKTNEKEVVIREGKAPDVFQFKGRTFVANSHNSFVELVKNKTKANKAAAVVAYNEKSIRCLVDDTVREHPFEYIDFSYKYSVSAIEWLDILTRGRSFDHKEFIDFIKCQDTTIQDLDNLLTCVKNFKYAIKIDGDFSYDDNNNCTLMIKKGETEGTIKIPQYVYVMLDLFEESGFTQVIETELEITRPTSEKDRPRFILTCPKFKRYEKAAKDNLVEYIKKELIEYLVVAGSI